ncbi:enoyl-CoA hydratase [Hyphomicrobium methylovorum]|uniref:enoyl-CoA hydratase n=1 Tax=Hyphomicrobium methylovorum TaxID=84 RepID=UPI0015E68249|nr:enoyl-CoA hydratase [Hyphomicrobium methylovorum]
MQDTPTDAPAILLQSEVEPGVAMLTLNRPDARNALSPALIRELHDAIERLGKDDTIGAIIIAAKGSVFCSGHDVKELTAHRSDPDGGKAFYRKTMYACSAMMLSIVMCPKPVIAAVEGHATAAGCQLVATCDLAVASSHADFATPGVNIGLFCSTPMVALNRNVSRKRAMEMLLLGEPISATEAKNYGLINRVMPAGSVVGEAAAMAHVIASKSRTTVAMGKAAFYRQTEMGLVDAYSFASEVMVDNLMTPAAEEGIAAFLEKRPPNWGND